MVRVLLVSFALVSVASAQNAQSNTRIFGGLGNLAGNLAGGAQQGFGQQGFSQQGFGQQGFHQRPPLPHQQGFYQGFNPGLQQRFGSQVFPGQGGFGVEVSPIGVGDGASAAVTKQGQCPPVRPSCPPIRFDTTPRQCSSDGGCGGLDKCCFDPCLQHQICKPPIGFSGQGRPVQSRPEQVRPIQGLPEQGRPEESRPGQVSGDFPDTISFEEHMSKYDLVFINEGEKLKRKNIFLVNLKKIQDHNILHDAGTTSYRMGLNQFSHLTYDELISSYTGLNEFDAALGPKTLYKPIDPSNSPTSLDWTNKGVLNPVQHQGICGSCWAFAVACVIESQIKKEKRVLQKLSEQYLVDCDTSNFGCLGGYSPRAITYVINNGIALDSGYPYTSGPTNKSGTCNEAAPKTTYRVASQQSIMSENDADLLNANIHIGPISVGIHIPKNMANYIEGVFDDKFCNKGGPRNHIMVLVGYGTEKNQKYWLLRNSWGPGWGANGYIKISREIPNNCQISSTAVFPILKGSCMPDPCGINADCHPHQDSVCTCPQGYEGNPLIECKLGSSGQASIQDLFCFVDSGQCYKFLNKILTFDEADKECKNEGLVLPMPKDPISLRSYVVENIAPSTDTWVGARGTGGGQKCCQRWIRTGTTMHPHSPLWLSTAGEGLSRNCMALVTRQAQLKASPDKPYYNHRCRSSYWTLCEYLF